MPDIYEWYWFMVASLGCTAFAERLEDRVCMTGAVTALWPP